MLLVVVSTGTISVSQKVSVVRFKFSYLFSNRIGAFVWKSSFSKNADQNKLKNHFSRASSIGCSTKYFLIPNNFALKTRASARRIPTVSDANSTAIENNPSKRCLNTRKRTTLEARQRQPSADPNVGGAAYVSSQ